MSGSHQRPHSPLLISKDTVSKFHFLDVFSELPGLGSEIRNSHFLDIFSELAGLGFWDANTQVSLRPVFSWGNQDRSLGGGKRGRVQDSEHQTKEAVSWGRGLTAWRGSSYHRTTFSLWLWSVWHPRRDMEAEVWTQLTSMFASWSGSSRCSDWFSRVITSFNRLQTDEEMD